jgi:hypothetical protein
MDLWIEKRVLGLFLVFFSSLQFGQGKRIGQSIYTGYSLTDQHNILTFNPKYDDRLFVELRFQYVLYYIKFTEIHNNPK